ncbi:WD repeat-containing protein 37 [Geodia barretti]|uniref:WD repeat-containing protein 37 n=3 Tax=Geodia barretti TaxID=519541 RepID=A0AA35T1E8_GEOBA|nr:WD repeat-containing protein 37 [Geodia barretti]
MKIKNNTRGQTITQRLKTYTPSKKSRSTLSVEMTQVCVFQGHRDGIWDVAHTRSGPALVGAASADGVALMWDVESGHAILKYIGHTGSVNGLSFHPRDTLCCSVAGDSSAHIWKYSSGTHARQRSSSGNPMDRSTTKHDSSGEERNLSDEDPTVDTPPVATVKQPVRVLTEHRAPVMACDWLADGHQLVTASWDHTAKLWDIESGQIIHSLEGHDQELTHVSAHPTQQLLVTSSVDTTFRLCDFRAPPIHSVNVFQGHSKAVNSCAFSLRDNIVSASDDHSLKIWDLRNMRSPLDSVRLDCGINRISVSHGNRPILAVPLDNRHLKLYDLSGSRLAQLPRRQRQAHRRMVCSVTWSHDSHVSTERCNLFSAGFDNKVVGWKVKFEQQ